MYDFRVSREPHGPEEFLRDHWGYLQADAYGGYDSIYLKENGAIKEVSRWAQTRCWYKAREADPARAHHLLAIVAKLYEVEHAAREKSADSRTECTLL